MGRVGLPKWEFSTGEKAFHAGKNIRENDLAPSEKYSSYAPANTQTNEQAIKQIKQWHLNLNI